MGIIYDLLFSDKEFSDIRFFPERQVKGQEDVCN